MGCEVILSADPLKSMEDLSANGMSSICSLPGRNQQHEPEGQRLIVAVEAQRGLSAPFLLPIASPSLPILA